MANMSYCRFENTLHDLRDCYDHWDDAKSESELKARKWMLKLITDMAENLSEE